MSDPKSTDDAPPKAEATAATAPSFSSKPPQAAFVVPYESIDDELDAPPPPASVIVRQSYANEVPPVVARPQKRPGEDEPTSRVEVIDDAAIAAELGLPPPGQPTPPLTEPTPAEAGEAPPVVAPPSEGPPEGPTRRIAVVTDADLADEEGYEAPAEGGSDTAPAVIVDGPSEAYAAHGADRCPYCLTFVGLSNARSRGVRYCPMCGADWNSLDRKVEAPTGAVIPLGDDALPPIEDELEDHPTNQFTRLGPVRPEPGEPGFVAPPEPPPVRRNANPWLMLLTGVSLGLAGTMTMAWLYNRRQPPPPTVVSQPPPTPRVSPPVVQMPIEDDASEAPIARKPVVDTPVVDKPVVDTPVVDTPVVDTPVVDTPVVEPAPVTPRSSVSEDMVQAALLDATSLLPPRALVEIRPRIDSDIVFLTGVVDSTETLGQVVAAVAAVQGVRAVDSRGVRPAWKSYTVVKGDSLSKIAQLYYGDTNAWPGIYEANREVVKSPSALHPGMKLRIPMGSGERR